MIRNEIFSWALKLWLVAVIGFTLFCLGRHFNHFPKHDEKQTEARLPAEVEMYVVKPTWEPIYFYEIEVYEAVKTAGNSYEILRRVK